MWNKNIFPNSVTEFGQSLSCLFSTFYTCSDLIDGVCLSIPLWSLGGSEISQLYYFHFIHLYTC